MILDDLDKVRAICDLINGRVDRIADNNFAIPEKRVLQYGEFIVFYHNVVFKYVDIDLIKECNKYGFRIQAYLQGEDRVLYELNTYEVIMKELGKSEGKEK